MATSSPAVLTLQGIGKDYAAPVLDGVSIDLHAGQVLALTGENGAGKSTLSKIICGLVTPTRGQMQLGGQPFAPRSRRAAEAQGVRMVMQELGLVATLTVAENLLLGRLPNRAGWLQRGRLHALAQRQLDRIGLSDIDPGTPVSQLGIGHQQMVEIARNLQDDTRVLILDEPTAMLTARESERLFEQIAQLAAAGVALVYVSHRLEELRRICDRVAVLRDGRLVDTRPMAGVSEADLVQRMIGRQLADDAQRPRRPAGPLRLRVRGLGRGQAVRQRIGLVSEDRKSEGLLLQQPIRVNTTLSDLGAVARRGWLQRGKERGIVQHLVRKLRVRCRDEEQAVGALSGGNQQKVVFARWLHRDCEVLLLDEPTRGVDVGARADLYAELERMASDGRALLMVSSDLRELMAMCDRIGVMRGGRLVQVFERGDWTEQALLAAAFSGVGEPTGQETTA